MYVALLRCGYTHTTIPSCTVTWNWTSKKDTIDFQYHSGNATMTIKAVRKFHSAVVILMEIGKYQNSNRKFIYNVNSYFELMLSNGLCSLETDT